ncbi:MAG: CbiX/SirB N-terminal domain-containing protein [Hyphomicrobiaceae bacterium]
MPARQSANPVAVVLVAHGERGGAFSNAVLLGHRDRVAARLPGVAVHAGVLSGDPAFEDALAGAAATGPGPILVYPFFMAAGYFVGTKIPKRIADAGLAGRCRILAPLSAAPSLPDLIVREALRCGPELGAPAADCRLVVCGHGSEVSRASAEATCKAVAAIASTAPFASVVPAFLEEEPFLPDVLAADARPTVVSGFFNGDGLHARDDVPEAIAAASGRTVYTGPIGAVVDVAGIMVDAIEAEMSGLVSVP